MISAAITTRGLGGREGRGLAALALDHDALGTSPVDLAHLYVSDLVVRFDALYHLCHHPPFPFPGQCAAQGRPATFWTD